MKKIVVILLSFGAIFILVLLGVGYKLSTDFRAELQMNLNNSMVKINDEFNKNNVRVKFEPFVCSGLMGYECVSKNIEIIQKNTQEKMIGLNDVGLSIEGIRRDKLEFSLNLGGLSLDFIDREFKDLEGGDEYQIYEIFKPKSLKCNQKNKILDKKTGEIRSQTHCNILTDAINYEIGSIERIKSETFIDKRILESLIQYYSFAFSSNKESIERTADFYDAIDGVSYEMDSKNLKEFLYPIVKSYYEKEQQKPYGEFNDKAYEMMIGNFKSISGLALGAIGILGSPYQGAILELVDGIEKMAIKKASGVKISLVPKQEKAPYFNLSSDVLLNMEHQGAQQKIFAKIFNNYDLKTQIIPNATK